MARNEVASVIASDRRERGNLIAIKKKWGQAPFKVPILDVPILYR